MLLHQDASRHAWLEGQPRLDLVVGLDDAASEVYSAFLVEEDGRALQRLGIERIAAYSPEARGRSERVFRTRQDRLAKELRLAGFAAANRWLAEVWEIFCVQEERQVGNDNAVTRKRLCLQIPPSPLRPHFVRTQVRVHEYPDGRLALSKGPHRLAD